MSDGDSGIRITRRGNVDVVTIDRPAAANPPLAIARIKQGLRRALDPDWEDLGAWVSRSLADLFRTDDHREGVRAFLEKRPPKFAGT